MAGYQSKVKGLMYNWKFVAHIIRDIFDPKDHVITFGTNFELMDILRSPEFGIETWGLHVKTDLKQIDNVHHWNISFNDSYFGRDYAELFIAIDYLRTPAAKFLDLIALHVWQLMQTDGIVFAVDPGGWIDKFDALFKRRTDLEQQVKRYTLFMDKQIYIYQK